MLVIITFATDRHFKLVDIGQRELGEKYNSRQKGGEASSTATHTHTTIQGTAVCDVSITEVVGEAMFVPVGNIILDYSGSLFPLLVPADRSVVSLYR